jgi:hypothetical protein
LESRLTDHRLTQIQRDILEYTNKVLQSDIMVEKYCITEIL